MSEPLPTLSDVQARQEALFTRPIPPAARQREVTRGPIRRRPRETITVMLADAGDSVHVAGRIGAA